MRAEFVLILLAVIVLAVPVDAKPEKIVMVPYNVSFDTGNVGAYSINIKPPEDLKNLIGLPYTLYEATIDGMSERIPHLVKIDILDFNAFVGNNIEEAVKDEEEFPMCGEPDVVARTIDGKEGAISPACGGTIVVFGYPLVLLGYPIAATYNGSMFAAVITTSTYPWYGGTSNLVDTIHVERS